MQRDELTMTTTRRRSGSCGGRSGTGAGDEDGMKARGENVGILGLRLRFEDALLFSSEVARWGIRGRCGRSVSHAHVLFL